MPLTPDLDAAAYRVIQEALLSTLQHTTDARADVVVRYLDDELQVEVNDDGRPVEDADVTQETAGLMAARDEVAVAGRHAGRGPSQGTRLLGPGPPAVRARLVLTAARLGATPEPPAPGAAARRCPEVERRRCRVGRCPEVEPAAPLPGGGASCAAARSWSQHAYSPATDSTARRSHVSPTAVVPVPHD